MKKTVVDYNGNIVNIESMQESLRDFPSFARKVLSDDGVPGLTNVVLQMPECGCDIIGNGTLQFPMKIKFCNKHNQVK